MNKKINIIAGFSIAAICLSLLTACPGGNNSGDEPSLANLTVNNRAVTLGKPSSDLNTAVPALLNLTNDEALFGVDIVVTAVSSADAAEFSKMTPGLNDTNWISSGKLTFMNGDILAIQVINGGAKRYYRLAVQVAPPDVAYSKKFHSWALTPPMGWNSFDCFGCNVTEEQVKQNAEYVARNLRKYGYEYIVVDGRWFAEKQTTGDLINQFSGDAGLVLDEWGRHTPALNKFPSAADGEGFKPLADYVHSLGLKFGIHIMQGIPVKAVQKKLPIMGADGITADQIHTTEDQCSWLHDNYNIVAGKPGAQEYYDSIFELYAEWGVDYVKIDDISKPYRTEGIEMVRNAIDKTGRPIVLSLSPGITEHVNAAHVKEHANQWRVTNDVWDYWGDVVHLLDTAYNQNWYPQDSGPGFWPDADMMPFGKINITDHAYGRGETNRWPIINHVEQNTLMSMFAILRSPLMLGGNLPDNDEFTTDLITNEEVLYITKRSKNNRQVYENGDRSVVAWAADDSVTGDKFLALFFCGSERPGQTNKGTPYSPYTQEISFDLSLLGFTADKVMVRDLWKKADIGEFVIAEQKFKPELEFHGAGLYRVSGK